MLAPLRTAQEACARYGWPLQVIDDAGHFLVAEQPKAFIGRSLLLQDIAALTLARDLRDLR
ncbi:MAG TPA: hypothetical protein VGS14_02135 [Actinomycetes bacterium]|jgi:pimeloyl-ACP methyl ester carboxylesterase|nr:hypothetical protein [Actinomycetes bacterium]